MSRVTKKTCQSLNTGCKVTSAVLIFTTNDNLNCDNDANNDNKGCKVTTVLIFASNDNHNYDNHVNDGGKVTTVLIITSNAAHRSYRSIYPPYPC